MKARNKVDIVNLTLISSAMQLLREVHPNEESPVKERDITLIKKKLAVMHGKLSREVCGG